MRIIRVNDYEDLSYHAAEWIIRKIKHSERLILGLATGATPLGTYRKLIEDHKKNHTSYKNVYTVNLDEYVGLAPEDPRSYHYYMDSNLFNHIDIPKCQTHIPNGMAPNLIEECEKYEATIDKLGGIDLQILGIGQNGHIGFNEPGTPFDSLTHVVKLTMSTRNANKRYFKDFHEVPTHAMTMGIKSILESKEILLLASGENKAEAMYKLIHGEISEQFPASALKTHPNVTIIADKEALSLINQKTLNLIT
jgi:glucosamine-6-phosphate deaminase